MLSRIIAWALMLCCGATPPATSALRGGPSAPERRQGADDVEFAEDWSNDTESAFNDTDAAFNGTAVDGMAPTQPKSTDEAARASGGRKSIKTLYHTTSPEIAALILRTAFKPGRAGWCGGAIYFLDTPTLPRSKYGWHTQAGAVIEAVVDMGRMASMGTLCNATFGVGMGSAALHGYDSLRFDPGDGEEFVILSSDRVISMRLYK